MTQITKTEARELKSLVNSSLNVVQSQIKHRATAIKEEIERRLVEQREQDLREANRKLRAFEKKARKLETEARELEIELSDKGISGNLRAYGDNSSILQIEVATRAEISKLNDLVNKEFGRLRVDSSGASLVIEEKRNQLIRELALSQVQSIDAQAFLDRIPTLETILPALASSEMRQIKA